MNDKGNIIIYQTKDGQTLIDVRLENETVWINRQQMAELFDRDVKTIGKHFLLCCLRIFLYLASVFNHSLKKTEYEEIYRSARKCEWGS